MCYFFFKFLDYFVTQSTLQVQVLAATQTPGEAGMNWFQGTADAVRQFIWVFEVGKEVCNNGIVLKLKKGGTDSNNGSVCCSLVCITWFRVQCTALFLAGCQKQGCWECTDFVWRSSLPNGLYGLCAGIIISLHIGLVFVKFFLHIFYDMQSHVDRNADITISCAAVGDRSVFFSPFGFTRLWM